MLTTRISRRAGHQIEIYRAVELPDNDQVREALNIQKPGLKLRQDFKYAVCVVLCAETFGDLARVLVGTADESDWARCKHR